MVDRMMILTNLCSVFEMNMFVSHSKLQLIVCLRFFTERRDASLFSTRRYSLYKDKEDKIPFEKRKQFGATCVTESEH